MATAKCNTDVKKLNEAYNNNNLELVKTYPHADIPASTA